MNYKKHRRIWTHYCDRCGAVWNTWGHQLLYDGTRLIGVAILPPGFWACCDQRMRVIS